MVNGNSLVTATALKQVAVAIKNFISGLYAKPTGGIPETDLAQAVQTKLNDRGTSVVVDAALDASSENAIQNKVVKAALDGKADTSHTHSYLPLSGGTLTGDLRLKGSSNYGRKINLGDGEFVYLKETTDDALDIYAAKGINLKTNGSTGVVKVNGTKVSVEGHAHSEYAASSHSHSISNITNLQTTLDGKAASSHSHSYNDLTDKPTIPAAVTIDSALSGTSTNPVQNKVVKTALDGKQPTIDDLATIRSNAAAVSSKADASHSHSYNDLTDKPTIPAAVVIDSALSGTSTNPVQNKVVKAALDGKQPTIDDLATIRSNAAAVSGKYSKPSSGIPETDLAQAVQDKLNASGSSVDDSTLVHLSGAETITGVKTFNANINMNAHKVTNLGIPSAGGDAVNKNYVDDQLGGYKIQVVTALPSSPNANTIYFVK